MKQYLCRAHRCWTLNNNNNNSFQKLNGQLRKLSSLVANSSPQTKTVSSQLSESHNDDEKEVTTINQSDKVLDPRPPSKLEATGIIAVIGRHPKVTATVKKRNSHFHVHEIDPNGELVQLTDLGPPSVEPPYEQQQQYYTHCTLYKNGVSTVGALTSLFRRLQTHPTNITYAGRKDSRGCTSQRIFVRNVHADHLIRLSKQSPDVKLGNFTYSSHPLSVGELGGNHFRILLTDVQTQNSSPISGYDAVKIGMDSLGQFGYINYCGLQRMEVSGLPAFSLGRVLFQENWEKFFDIMLTPVIHDGELMEKVKAMWSADRNPVAILEENPALKDTKKVEGKLMLGLSKFYNGGKGDLVKAVKAIPFVYRNMYVTSFQSLLWNQVATYRIQKFGLEPVPGDCVLIDEDDDSRSVYLKKKEKDDKYEWISRLKILTEADLNSSHNKYSIHDIILPGPGSEYPRYSHPVIQKYYENLLIKYGLDTEILSKTPPPSSDRAESRYSFYRHLVVKPKDVKYAFFTYNNVDDVDFDTLIPSDLDLLLHGRRNVGKFTPVINGTGTNRHDDVVTNRGKTGDKVCAVIEFSLRSAAYATMALREVIQDPYEPAWPDIDDDFSVPKFDENI